MTTRRTNKPDGKKAEPNALKGRELHGDSKLPVTLSSSIDRLGLSTRVTNTLRKAGIPTVEGLLHKLPWELLRVRGLGEASLKGIQKRLGEHGLDALGWSPWALDTLKEARITSLSQLECMSVLGFRDRLNSIFAKEYNEKRAYEIREELSKLGLSFLPSKRMLSVPISYIGLHHTPYQALKRNGVYTARELIQLSEGDLLDMYGVGQRGVQQIKEWLKKFDLKLRSAETKATPHSGIHRIFLNHVDMVNDLYSSGIHTIGDLTEKSESELSKILSDGRSNLMVRSKLRIIKINLAKAGFSLKGLGLPSGVRLDSLDIGELDLKADVTSILRKNNISTLADLTQKTEDELLSLGGFGRRSLWAVKISLEDRALSLRED